LAGVPVTESLKATDPFLVLFLTLAGVFLALTGVLGILAGVLAGVFAGVFLALAGVFLALAGVFLALTGVLGDLAGVLAAFRPLAGVFIISAKPSKLASLVVFLTGAALKGVLRPFLVLGTTGVFLAFLEITMSSGDKACPVFEKSKDLGTSILKVGNACPDRRRCWF